MIYEKYLVTEASDKGASRLKKAWGDANLKVVYSQETDKGAWIVIGKHNTGKYYGVNYMDEIIDAVSKQKAQKWASDFIGKPVKIK